MLPVFLVLSCGTRPPAVSPAVERCVEGVTTTVLTLACDYLESHTDIRCSDLLPLLLPTKGP